MFFILKKDSQERLVVLGFSFFLKNLVDIIKSMFKGETQDALMALLLPKPNFDAMCLYNGLKVCTADACNKELKGHVLFCTL